MHTLHPSIVMSLPQEFSKGNFRLLKFTADNVIGIARLQTETVATENLNLTLKLERPEYRQDHAQVTDLSIVLSCNAGRACIEIFTIEQP